jgi:hypothetical protein
MLEIRYSNTIMNTATRAAILSAAHHSSSVRDRKDAGTDSQHDLGYRVYSQINAGFWVILDSPLGMVVLRALQTHAFEMKFKYVEKVIVVGRKNEEEFQKGKSSPHIYFMLSE